MFGLFGWEFGRAPFDDAGGQPQPAGRQALDQQIRQQALPQSGLVYGLNQLELQHRLADHFQRFDKAELAGGIPAWRAAAYMSARTA